jgi:hypothetical protein
MSSSEVVSPFRRPIVSMTARAMRGVALVGTIVAVNIAAAGAVLFQLRLPFLSADVDWLITFDLTDVSPQYTLLTTALASAQVGLLAVWVIRGAGSPAIRWLALAAGIAAWSVVLEFLHPAVAHGADSRAIFTMQAALILTTLTGVDLLRKRRGADGAAIRPQWTLGGILGVFALLSLALATSRFMQPNQYNSPVTWEISYWRIAVAATSAFIALSAYWAGRRPKPAAPMALVMWATAGAALALLFAKVPAFWPPAHNPGEAHYAEVFWPFCRSYATWAVIQGSIAFGVSVAAIKLFRESVASRSFRQCE